jgi:DNA (cytosine-5)-methyltransferase 1
MEERKAITPPLHTQRFYEFFAGAGMAREGLGPEWSCAFANDIDPKKGAAYAANFGRQGLKVDDVAKLTAADLPGRADLAWASFPCEDLSEAGDRKGLAGFRSNVIWPCLRLVDALRAEGRPPRVIVLENVTGLLGQNQALFFDAIGNALTAMGYLVAFADPAGPQHGLGRSDRG